MVAGFAAVWLPRETRPGKITLGMSAVTGLVLAVAAGLFLGALAAAIGTPIVTLVTRRLLNQTAAARAELSSATRPYRHWTGGHAAKPRDSIQTCPAQSGRLRLLSLRSTD